MASSFVSLVDLAKNCMDGLRSQMTGYCTPSSGSAHIIARYDHLPAHLARPPARIPSMIKYSGRVADEYTCGYCGIQIPTGTCHFRPESFSPAYYISVCTPCNSKLNTI